MFYYLTYEGAVDFELIGDERAQQAIKDQIQSFGQTPTKVKKKRNLFYWIIYSLLFYLAF